MARLESSRLSTFKFAPVFLSSRVVAKENFFRMYIMVVNGGKVNGIFRRAFKVILNICLEEKQLTILRAFLLYQK